MSASAGELLEIVRWVDGNGVRHCDVVVAVGVWAAPDAVTECAPEAVAAARATWRDKIVPRDDVERQAKDNLEAAIDELTQRGKPVPPDSLILLRWGEWVALQPTGGPEISYRRQPRTVRGWLDALS